MLRLELPTEEISRQYYGKRTSVIFSDDSKQWPFMRAALDCIGSTDASAKIFSQPPSKQHMGALDLFPNLVTNWLEEDIKRALSRPTGEVASVELSQTKINFLGQFVCFQAGLLAGSLGPGRHLNNASIPPHQDPRIMGTLLTGLSISAAEHASTNSALVIFSNFAELQQNFGSLEPYEFLHHALANTAFDVLR